ncbi:MAG TPA: serine/threonine-protein kinase, partial [Ktedonobacteraceae bacterium]
MVDHTGQQLGNYQLVRLLGRGGFAEVYLGEHVRLKSQAAIKVRYEQFSKDDAEEFLKEAQTIANLVHPHIVRIFDFDVHEGVPFLVMEYAPNGTLRQRYPKNTRVPLETIISNVKQVADALQYAHDEKFMHRDIKPENLLLGRRDDILLSDFGLALVAQSTRQQSLQELSGTAYYMAPEQLRGKPRPASDQYALGVVVYEWLTGMRPFTGSFSEVASQHMFEPPPPLRDKLPSISPTIEEVVMTALAKDPHQRFASVRSFANALEQASQVSASFPGANLVNQPAAASP